MIECFTERAKCAIVLAREEAIRVKNPYLGTEHILLGLIKKEDGTAAEILKKLGLDLREIRFEVERRISHQYQKKVENQVEIPFTNRAKKVLELAIEEANIMGHDRIRTGHLLIGLIKEGEGHASLVLEDLKLDLADIRLKLIHQNQLKFPILRALEEKKLKEEVVLLRKKLQERFDFGAIITADPKMFDIFDRLRKISPSDLSVLITGENGTGKKLAAQAIHYNSHRKEGPFTPMDFATIPESLFESEVFGYYKGAFTGADQNKKGLFEKAQGGTLFLNELGNLRLEFQSKLLRVIQERKILPLGGKDYIDLNIRLISATNTDLEAAKDNGQFREDLYFRINQYHIHIPPLRERLNDIKLLANHFLSEIAKAKGKKTKVQEISPESLDILMGYSWPGNVRQLKGVMQSASVMAEGKILPEHLPPELVS